MQCYLGIDGGGSGSRWALLDEAGIYRFRGTDGPSLQAAELGVALTAARLTEVLQTVLEQMHGEVSARSGAFSADSSAASSAGLTAGEPGASARDGSEDADRLVLAQVVVGLAGIGDVDSRRELESRVQAAGAPVTVTEDTTTGAAAALADGPGVAVFAGTGSFAIARDAAGRLHRVGGRGSQASDHGSGYWLVRAAAEAALLAVDDLGPETALERVVAQAFGLADAKWIGHALKEQPVRSIASRFPDVVRAAESGDAEAGRIIQEGAAGLARLVAAALRRAELNPAAAAITLGGGTMSVPSYFGAIETQLRTGGMRGRIRPLPMRSEDGGALLAQAAAVGKSPLCDWLHG